MIKKNEPRERLILSEWMKGRTGREVAELLRLPEGSVSGYFRRYNKDPVKYHRLAQQTLQEVPSILFDLPNKVIELRKSLDVIKGYDRLIESGKYHQGKAFLEAEKLKEEFYRIRMGGLASVVWYASNPTEYNFLLPKVIEEIRFETQKLGSAEKMEFVKRLESQESVSREHEESWNKLLGDLRKRLHLPRRDATASELIDWERKYGGGATGSLPKVN